MENKKATDQYVFVYGTLKVGRGNHHVMGRSEKIKDFVTAPVYKMIASGFPIVLRGGNTPITGEVYKVTNPETLDRIYMLEGFRGVQGDPHNWYDVDLIDVGLDKPAQIFVQNGDPRPGWRIVENGNF